MSSVVSDEVVEAVEQLLRNQVVLGLSVLLYRSYSTVIHGRVRRTLSPETYHKQ